MVVVVVVAAVRLP